MASHPPSEVAPRPYSSACPPSYVDPLSAADGLTLPSAVDPPLSNTSASYDATASLFSF